MNIYKLNVSGKLYDIKHDILIKIPYFMEYINSDVKEPVCFVQRSSNVFDHVLAYVIDRLHPYPSKYFYELDFYGLTYKKDIYKVNMLGKIYHLKTDLLMKIPYFAKRINDINNSSVDIFVDRSPVLFDNVLAYIMDDTYPIDYRELDFYGIKYNQYRIVSSDIHKIKNQLDDDMYTIKKEIGNIITKLDEISSVEKTFCKVSYCKKYIDEDREYCYDHGECNRCYDHANRSDDFLCDIHKNEQPC